MVRKTNKLTFKADRFQCKLYCNQCRYIKPNRRQCGNRVCIGTPFCWMHNKQLYGIKVKNSAVSGKGLFATRRFHTGTFICPYIGETISKLCSDTRFPGTTTSPYGMEYGHRVIDSACRRGIGSMANGLFYRNRRTQPIHRHNAKFVVRNGSIWLQATRNINEDEEIYAWYGNDYELQDNHKTYRTTLDDTRPC
jgi:hypothetical protein